VSELYHEGARELQDRFDTRRIADRLEQVKVHDAITDDDRAFIERMDMLFLATCDAEGRPQCSYKGGDPGFVTVVDAHTVAFPSYDGNGMYLSAGNVRVNAHVGLLFVDFAGEPPRRLRLNGVARVEPDDPLLARYSGAQFVIRVRAEQLFPNCPRYIHRMALVERSRYLPRAGYEPPVPAWKRAGWARDALPARDQTSGRSQAPSS
jgi:predicted pyridoxine 5'-phosphate oxidase superfamily flavin-nucleotide-binding protein